MRERPLVIKFGGTSVGDGAAFLRAAEIVAEAAKDRPVAVVVSAMAGTTDALLGFVVATGGRSLRTSTGATHEGSLAELNRTLADGYLRAARESVSPEHLPEVEERLLMLLERLVESVEAPVTDPAARKARVAVFGERLSATILAGAIRSQGPSAGVVAGDPIATGPEFSASEVDAAETERRCARYVAPLLDEGVVAVVPGYVGRSPEGLPTTLGRGGSDLSATVLGRALNSREVWIMSDVDGVLDADPDLIPSSALIPRLSYREAGQFASLGAKVLHPKAMEPASAAGIEVRVGSTFNPGSPGTLISCREGGPGVRSVALRRNLSLVHVPPEAAGNVFCILGADAEGFKALEEDASGNAAAVICIGTPTDEDLLVGLRCLRETNIEPLFAGNTSTGLVFAVSEGDVGDALRALYAVLVPSETPADMEEVA
ncbi:MAG: aspartate kinase [Actinobacteria bacterium]|nr:aspartate kinase [Actinomycetota bacterium]